MSEESDAENESSTNLASITQIDWGAGMKSTSNNELCSAYASMPSMHSTEKAGDVVLEQSHLLAFYVRLPPHFKAGTLRSLPADSFSLDSADLNYVPGRLPEKKDGNKRNFDTLCKGVIVKLPLKEKDERGEPKVGFCLLMRNEVVVQEEDGLSKEHFNELKSCGKRKEGTVFFSYFEECKKYCQRLEDYSGDKESVLNMRATSLSAFRAKIAARDSLVQESDVDWSLLAKMSIKKAKTVDAGPPRKKSKTLHVPVESATLDDATNAESAVPQSDDQSNLTADAQDEAGISTAAANLQCQPEVLSHSLALAVQLYTDFVQKKNLTEEFKKFTKCNSA